MHSKKRLYLFTDVFPYGVGEKTFIIPEINHLSEKFDITIISSASDVVAGDQKNITPVSCDMHVLRLKRGSRFRLALYGLLFPFSKMSRREVRDILSSKRNRTKRIIDSLKFFCGAQSIRAFCRKHGFFCDIGNSVFYTYWINDYTMALALEKQVQPELKLVSRTHGYDLYDERNTNGRQPFRWFIDQACNEIIFACESAKVSFENKVRKDLQEKNASHSVIRLGTVPPGRIPGRDDKIENQFTIVSCSNVIPLKRVDLIAKAIADLKDPTIKWIHFGDGIDLEKIRDFASEHNLNAEFKGHVSNEELKDFYENNFVDAFITASSTEGGCPVSITEALALGVPIIGTNVGGIPEQIDGNGILLSKNPTVREIGNSIKEIMELDEGKLRVVRNNSMVLFYKKFNLDSNISFLLKAIDEVENKTRS